MVDFMVRGVNDGVTSALGSLGERSREGWARNAITESALESMGRQSKLLCKRDDFMPGRSMPGYKMLAEQALETLHVLYADDKIISYPRTDSRVLPSSYLRDAPKNFRNLNDMVEWSNEGPGEEGFEIYTSLFIHNDRLPKLADALEEMVARGDSAPKPLYSDELADQHCHLGIHPTFYHDHVRPIDLSRLSHDKRLTFLSVVHSYVVSHEAALGMIRQAAPKREIADALRDAAICLHSYASGYEPANAATLAGEIDDLTAGRKADESTALATFVASQLRACKHGLPKEMASSLADVVRRSCSKTTVRPLITY